MSTSGLIKTTPSQTEAVVSLGAEGKLAIHYWTEANLATVEKSDVTQEVIEEQIDETPVTETSTDVTENINETKEAI